MTLETRLAALAAAVGADVKELEDLYAGLNFSSDTPNNGDSWVWDSTTGMFVPAPVGQTLEVKYEPGSLVSGTIATTGASFAYSSLVNLGVDWGLNVPIPGSPKVPVTIEAEVLINTTTFPAAGEGTIQIWISDGGGFTFSSNTPAARSTANNVKGVTAKAKGRIAPSDFGASTRTFGVLYRISGTATFAVQAVAGVGFAAKIGYRYG